MNAFGKIIGILIATIIFFFVPIFVLAQRQELMIESYVLTKTAYLVEHIRSNGYVSKEMYERYQRQLAQTGYLYTIEMEHQTALYDKDESGDRYQKQYQSTYEEDILKVLFGEEGIYSMKKGDFFFLKVASKTRGIADKMKSYFAIPTDSIPVIQVELGGMVRDEMDGL